MGLSSTGEDGGTIKSPSADPSTPFMAGLVYVIAAPVESLLHQIVIDKGFF